MILSSFSILSSAAGFRMGTKEFFLTMPHTTAPEKRRLTSSYSCPSKLLNWQRWKLTLPGAFCRIAHCTLATPGYMEGQLKFLYIMKQLMLHGTQLHLGSPKVTMYANVSSTGLQCQLTKLQSQVFTDDMFASGTAAIVLSGSKVMIEFDFRCV